MPTEDSIITYLILSMDPGTPEYEPPITLEDLT